MTGPYTLEHAVALWMSRSTRDGDCLNGPGNTYGRVHFEGIYMQAHRAVYLVHNGPIPQGLVVRHTCDNPRCVEPAHLLVGTYRDNNMDKFERGRQPVGADHYKATKTAGEIAAIVHEYLTTPQTQRQLAAKHGVSQGAISLWARGKQRRDSRGARVRAAL